ncbi:MAG: hypothetical protein WC444_04595 [Candidatus Paceibacterota bacterium]
MPLDPKTRKLLRSVAEARRVLGILEEAIMHNEITAGVLNQYMDFDVFDREVDGILDDVAGWINDAFEDMSRSEG